MTSTQSISADKKYKDNFQRLHPIILSGEIRNKNEDFIVDEIPSVEPIGTGEHVWLKIRKSGENTDWIAGLLAKTAGVKRRDVSYAGMKDRNAVTTQWFSIYLPGKDAPNWQENLPENIELLEETRHERKLRLGTLKGNRFQIVLRHCDYLNGATQATVEQRIATIREHGVPNYFGIQRFGRDFNNLYKAEAWFAGQFRPKKRNLQGIFLSSARSWIFNQILSERVKLQTWNQAIEGDIFMLNGSRSWFSETLNNEITQRVAKQEIHPTGALWGKGELASTDQMYKVEEQIGKENNQLAQGLIDNKLKQERRSLHLSLADLDYKWITPQDLQLNFSLPSGTYATSFLRELIEL